MLISHTIGQFGIYTGFDRDTATHESVVLLAQVKDDRIFRIKTSDLVTSIHNHARLVELVQSGVIPTNLPVRELQEVFSEKFYKIKTNAVKFTAVLWLHKPKNEKELYLDYYNLGGFSTRDEIVAQARATLEASAFTSGHCDVIHLATKASERILLKQDEASPDPECFSHGLVKLAR